MADQDDRDRVRKGRSHEHSRPTFRANPRTEEFPIQDTYDEDKVLLPGEQQKLREQQLEQEHQAFHRTENIRPSIPSSYQTEEEEESTVGDTTNKLQTFLGRNWLPTAFIMQIIRKIFAFIIPNSIQTAVKDRIDNLPESSKYRLKLVKIIFKWVFIAFASFAALVWIVSVLGGVTITEPKTAKALFERVPKTERVFYTTEIVRTKQIDGQELRQDQVLKLGVDLESNVFQFEAEGVEDDVIRFIGDGKTAIYSKGSDSTPGEVENYPSADSLKPLLAEELIPLADQLITNEATVQGEQGWLATWKPNKETILRMLSADLIQASGEDIEAIRKGEFTAEYATVTVYRKSKRIYQIMAVITVNEATMQILSTYRDYNAEALKDLSFEQESS